MKNNSIFHSPENATRNVVETVMKPLEWTKRPGRWLMAAAMALGLSQAPAQAEDLATPLTNNIFQLEPPAKPVQNGPVLEQTPNGPKAQLTPDRPGIPPRPEVVFTKTGTQIECDYVVYKLHFATTEPAAFWTDPNVVALLKRTKLDFSDQVPAGLSIISAAVTGDVTNAAGAGSPLSIIGTTATTNDTVKISDFRLSASDLDGDGSLVTRAFDVTITAKIDQSAFPAVTVVSNQGFVSVTSGTAVNVFASQDPSQPDDGDPKTGVPTKIKIDVTRCKPKVPHNPGGECFKVDTGTVDCDKNGIGAFVYHMNAGANMAGKVIELTTTNPGVTISPAGQIVPAGGGVLNWTITGAMPGDTVHIVVVGVQTFAGPEEGVGICCTQTIDIIIPKNLDCPKPKVPDIKVEKKADVSSCAKAGGCKFTIRVSNVGSAPYNGPIVLNEVTLPGNATIDGGPNAPWVCAPLTSPMLCKHPATTLNPGAFVDLKLSFKPGPGWNAHFIENCAKYNYSESGKPPFGSQLNDRACAGIPLCDPNGTTPLDHGCQPPSDKKADLQIRKTAREFCTADGLCTYGIIVTNAGAVSHNGPLTVVDNFPGGAPTSVTFAPTPPWACATVNPSQFQCVHPGIVLVPGASTAILVKAIVPLDYPNGKVENCAKVNPVATETNLANNTACSTAKLRQPDGRPVMKIEKTCTPGIAGAQIFCTVTVTNTGTAAPVGPVNVNDAAAMTGGGALVNIQSVTTDGPEWSCSSVPAANLSCQIPGAVMTPGTSRHFTATLAASPNGRWKNCARGNHGPAPGNDIVYRFGEACAEGGVDIVVKKTGDALCTLGQPCAFTITITNNGSSGFSGKLQIGDGLEIQGLGRLDGVAIQSIVPPFGCANEPSALPFGCLAEVSIPAGAGQPHVVTVVIPNDGALAGADPDGLTGRNCVGVTGENVQIGVSGEGAGSMAGGEEGGAFSCHPFNVIKEDKKLCSEGFVKNSNGRCVCPEGTRFNNATGQCSGGEVKPEEPKQPDEPQVEQPKLCKLLPGMIRAKNGNCLCRTGTELRNGECHRTQPPQCKLLPGMIRTNDNRCICPRGTVLGKRGCAAVVVPPRECKLLPGMIRTNDNRCICPKGTVLGKRGCAAVVVPPRECKLLPGMIRTNSGKCICPSGTALGRKGCVPVDRPTPCRRPNVMINGECMTPDNRDGPKVRSCPPGFIGIPPVCLPPEILDVPIKRRNTDNGDGYNQDNTLK
jgi:hypothetical protein